MPPIAGHDGQLLERFHAALLEAYPERELLEQMVRFGLNQNLEVIAGKGNLAATVFALLTWAEAQGRTKELLAAARARNQGNQALRAFAEELATRDAARDAQQAALPAEPRALLRADTIAVASALLAAANWFVLGLVWSASGKSAAIPWERDWQGILHHASAVVGAVLVFQLTSLAHERGTGGMSPDREPLWLRFRVVIAGLALAAGVLATAAMVRLTGEAYWLRALGRGWTIEYAIVFWMMASPALWCALAKYLAWTLGRIHAPEKELSAHDVASLGERHLLLFAIAAVTWGATFCVEALRAKRWGVELTAILGIAVPLHAAFMGWPLVALWRRAQRLGEELRLSRLGVACFAVNVAVLLGVAIALPALLSARG